MNPEVEISTKWIKQGQWTELVKWISQNPENYYILLAAYVQGGITSFELATAFMFSSCAASTDDWEIYPITPKSFSAKRFLKNTI